MRKGIPVVSFPLRTATVCTGTRYMKMDMKPEKPLTNFVCLSSRQATFEYRVHCPDPLQHGLPWARSTTVVPSYNQPAVTAAGASLEGVPTSACRRQVRTRATQGHSFTLFRGWGPGHLSDITCRVLRRSTGSAKHCSTCLKG